ncbi:MAG TPA: aldo/keto reductase [Candidatus Sulfopaludibacter sp.]|nr:aldo/keto reductase [Candidatus Sulfopaludibacter sp.]
MTRKLFGSTGLEVPVIGQGTWMIEGSSEQEAVAVDALRLGLDLGLTHIDTAEMYGSGRAEEVTGKAIAGRRDQVFLASKVLPSNASYDGTLQACERSLTRLGTDRLDLYLLHWESSYPIGETMRAMAHLIDTGQIRAAGVSNFDVNQLQAAQAALPNHRLASNQVLYHLGERGIERKLIPYCQQHQIAVVGYTPFGRGAFPKPSSPGGKVLAQVAERNGRTVRQVILNFLTRLPQLFTIPKAGNPDHTRENAGATGWNLSREDIAAIDRAFPAPTSDSPLAML